MDHVQEDREYCETHSEQYIAGDDCSKCEKGMNNLPDTIYLIPDSEGWVWCEDPTPGIGMEEADAVKYIKIPVTVAKGLKMPQTPAYLIKRADMDQELILEQRDEISRLKHTVNQLRQSRPKWIRCDSELPTMGMPVIAVCDDKASVFLPKFVYRTDHEQGWSWNTFGSDDYYSPNEAYFTHWVGVDALPQIDNP